MRDLRSVEVFAGFERFTGRLEVVRPDRLSDTVNRVVDHLQLEDARVEPLLPGTPRLVPPGGPITIARAAIAMLCTPDDRREGNPTMWREKIRRGVVLTTATLSLAAEVHLEPRHSLRDQLERHRRDFLPLTAVSAMRTAFADRPAQALQWPFVLLNPAAIVSFAPG